MILLIDNYDSFTYNLVQFLGELGVRCDVVRNDTLTVDDALARKPKAVVLSPGPRTPREAGICVDLIRAVDGGLPILGVCLGHQAIGYAYGGEIVRKTPMHGKLSTIRHGNRGLFAGLPNGITVTRYHSLCVRRESLPTDLDITAETDDGIVMGLQHRTHPVYGVQFHPESIASEHGHDLLANFLKLAGFEPRDRRDAA